MRRGFLSGLGSKDRLSDIQLDNVFPAHFGAKGVAENADYRATHSSRYEPLASTDNVRPPTKIDRTRWSQNVSTRITTGLS